MRTLGNRVPARLVSIVALATLLGSPLTTTAAAAAPRTSGTTASLSALPALASLHAGAVAGDQQLQLSWADSPTSGRYTKLHLELFQVINSVPVKVGSIIIGHTVEKHHYEVPVTPGTWIVHLIPENAAGFGQPIISGRITVANPCSTADLCARVSTTPNAPAVRQAGQGFLLGLTNWAGELRNAANVRALGPRQWRFAGPTSDPAARGLGVSRTQILSDLWNSATAPTNSGHALTPWSDWARWESFVQGTVRMAKAQGWAPDYWDVWNEPNGTCCPRFSNTDQSTVTVDRWLDAYVIAWRAIKAVDPAAKVVGPSLSALQWAPGAPAEFDLETFLAYSAEHHVIWDAVAWHENTTAPSPGDIASSVTNVDRHVAMARAVMARHPGTVVGNKIFINEYGAANVHMLAGWAIGFFRAFEINQVSQANRACWNEAECTTQLDGLLTPTGATTALWWAHKLYAGLAGRTRMKVASTSSWQLDGLATRDDLTHTVRALLGRHWSCNKPVNAWCTSDAHVPPASLSTTIDWPYGTAPVTVTASRLPASTTALIRPQLLRSTVVRPAAGKVTITLPAVNDGDGISIVATVSGK